MQRNRKFDFAMRIIFSVAIWLILSQDVANAKAIRGKFFNGQMYSGEYSVTEGVNSDGVRTNPITVKMTVGTEKNQLLYSYVADDPPSVKASDSGFLLIVVNSGGMEGSVTYNYVIPFRGKLVSIGTVQTTLHLGKIENIDAQPNKKLSKDEINSIIRSIVKFNPPTLIAPLNAYPTSTLILLGQDNYLMSPNYSELSKLYANKEISDDPVLLRAIKKVIGDGVQNDKTDNTQNKKIVIADRAYFYNKPNSPTPEKSYLIKGDAVSLIKRSDNGQYWLVDYISASGEKTEKWLHCIDIGYCQ
ncbi:hypothetical protein [Burkholderia arboris]|uniref:hypothetical protein n=1 Tax=Burkholderia arboris TaxID=488730 RepID=UPI0030EFF126